MRQYLPDNYELVELGRGVGNYNLIVGRDVAGWTLEEYVIARLSSGLIFAAEIDKEFYDEYHARAVAARARLEEEARQPEGVVNHPYQDPKGVVLTVRELLALADFALANDSDGQRVIVRQRGTGKVEVSLGGAFRHRLRFGLVVGDDGEEG